MANNKINIKNKKAYFNYEIIEKYEAGLALLGTEIKSIRAGKASLTDAYCKFLDNELWILMSISEYEFGNLNNHEPNRRRKLLLTKRELKKLERKIKNTGLTIIPLQLFFNEKGLAKIEIALAKGRKKYDHRQAIKEKDTKIDMARERKYKY
ncbi:MAG: SsrA-binding protein SmpB [Bacteroidales bacterium]|nr:SsrA-binding protein SmpB [Bacteroidales bacterium]